MVTRPRLSAALAALVALAALATLSASTTAAQPASHVAPAAGVRVMPLGDSITDGFNVPGGYRIGLWQKLLAGGHTVDFVGSMSNGPSSLGDRDHEGHSGWTIAQIDANVVNWLRTHTPRTILLHIGTNDMYGGDPGGAPQRLSALIDKITAQSPDADLFVATITPLANFDSAVRAFNATVPGIVRSKANAGKKVHLVDMYAALSTADLADGVHPNAGGYAKMATVWYNALRSVPGSIGDGGSPPTTTTSTPAGACTAVHRTVGSWQGGFQAEVTVTAGAAPITGWTVSWPLDSGQAITQVWGGVSTGGGATASVRNSAWNGALAAGASATFGYLGSGGPATPALTCTSP
ncbi:GDSL-type esterase/lipase family protein [Goodfellowiella coeruleoviolacea]|uniref:Lysophospholipase L1 n=1 Tax=Goodfellowiella coeruleoviolacea TaxID=334858 RepID=A0AAE3GA63_9PSEU|nr:GDSL-type esterase/lipase family protein [Goodfellowiella coeruleoviolacea]MCP2163229.1 Lysophospholipase L1 [Goodfellowiella coeruleoviolacea]